MAEPKGKIYMEPCVFKNAEWKDTTGQNKRWTVYTDGGKIYGFFHGATEQRHTMLENMVMGDKFTAHYTERLYNGKIYYTLEDVSDIEHDVSQDAQRQLPVVTGGMEAPNMTNEEALRLAGCHLAAELIPAMGLDGKDPGYVTSTFLIAAQVISEYIITGKMDVGDEDPDFVTEAIPDDPGKEYDQGDQQSSSPDGDDFPPEEEQEKPRARRTSTASR